MAPSSCPLFPPPIVELAVFVQHSLFDKLTDNWNSSTAEQCNDLAMSLTHIQTQHRGAFKQANYTITARAQTLCVEWRHPRGLAYRFVYSKNTKDPMTKITNRLLKDLRQFRKGTVSFESNRQLDKKTKKK
jgi:hypothetical protein